MSAKIHLLDASEPLRLFAGLPARCGYQFVQAEPVWMFREDFTPEGAWLESFNVLLICRSCMASLPLLTRDYVYLYGLVESMAWAEHFREEVE